MLRAFIGSIIGWGLQVVAVLLLWHAFIHPPVANPMTGYFIIPGAVFVLGAFVRFSARHTVRVRR